MKPEHTKKRKFMTTVVLAMVGLALIGLAYWLRSPIEHTVMTSAEISARSRVSNFASVFGLLFLVVACGINMPPRKKRG